MTDLANQLASSSSTHSHTAESPAPPVADLRNITKSYFKPDGTVMVKALAGIDLTISKGEYLAIMGASGSGKSTLMNILGCLDRPTTGVYQLDGLNVASADDETLSKIRGEKIGFVFQAFNLIPAMTVLENIEVPLFYQEVHRHERLERSKEKLKLVGLADRMDHRPSELSGGQQQRAAIARALVTDPAIILADEPTGNLDTATGEAILQIFDEFHNRGLTIIMVTHEDNVAERCQRIVTLKDGLVESDHPVQNSKDDIDTYTTKK